MLKVQRRDPTIYYSDKFISYRNYAVTRRNENISISQWDDLPQWDDLTGKSVCAWEGAKEDLGEEFKKAVIAEPEIYYEFPLQAGQVRFWLNENCTIIVIDDSVLKWWSVKLAPIITMNGTVINHDWTLSPLPNGHILWWYVGFKDAGLRNRFNATLAAMKMDGTYERIRNGFLESQPETFSPEGQ